MENAHFIHLIRFSEDFTLSINSLLYWNTTISLLQQYRAGLQVIVQASIFQPLWQTQGVVDCPKLQFWQKGAFSEFSAFTEIATVAKTEAKISTKIFIVVRLVMKNYCKCFCEKIIRPPSDFSDIFKLNRQWEQL